MATLTTGTELGGYRIEGLLGRGGMGIVYEAVQLSLGRTVALKLLAAELSENDTFRARFRREGRLQAALDHAHIVPIYEAGELGDEGLFIAMRLIRGPTLKELIRIHGLDAARTMKILTPVADALDTAHEGELVHRDVKPQNILVGRRDHAYLADFGLTRAPTDTAFTKTGSFVGTLDYIAPEQIRGESATAMSDLYSLAAVAFECLTGRVPFPKPNEASVLYAHMAEPPPRASEVRPELPRAVDAVIERALAKQPQDRYATALDLVVALDDALRSAPTPPPAPPPSEGAAVVDLGVSTEEVVVPRPRLDDSTVVTPYPRAALEPPAPAKEEEKHAGDATEQIVRPPLEAPAPEPAGRAPEEEESAVGEATEQIVRPPLEAPPAPEPAGPAPEEQEAAVDEATVLHDRAGAATYADRRRPWEPAARAAPAAPDRAEPPRQHVARRTAVVAGALAVVLVALAAVAGLTIGGGGKTPPADPTPAPAAAPETVASGGLSVKVPDGWRKAQDAPAIPGLALADAAALVPASGEQSGAVVVGRSGGSGRTLLPAAFLGRLGSAPKPDEAVQLGGARAYRYDDLRVDGAADPVTLYVAPLTSGVATVACVGAEDDCPGIAASLGISGSRKAVGLGPRKEYAGAVGAPISRFREQSRSAARDLTSARTSAGQAKAGARLQSAYAGLASRLARVRTTPLERSAHPALVRSARRAAAAYGALAKAARNEQGRAYARARAAAGRREAGVRAALRELGRLGYEVR